MIQVFRAVLSAGFTAFLVPLYITVPQFPKHKVWVGIAGYCQEEVMRNSFIFASCLYLQWEVMLKKPLKEVFDTQ